MAFLLLNLSIRGYLLDDHEVIDLGYARLSAVEFFFLLGKVEVIDLDFIEGLATWLVGLVHFRHSNFELYRRLNKLFHLLLDKLL